MTNFKESDSVRLRASAEGDVIGQQRSVLLPAGALAAVVLVHGDPLSPEAYELESYVSEQDCYVLATVPVDGVEPA